MWVGQGPGQDPTYGTEPENPEQIRLDVLWFDL